jgi:hypothetical protein
VEPPGLPAAFREAVSRGLNRSGTLGTPQELEHTVQREPGEEVHLPRP